MTAELEDTLNKDSFYDLSTEALTENIYRWLERVNPVGLFHPHGFFVIPLMKSEIEQWRFHIWPVGPRKINGMPAFIHTHNVDIDSRLLLGQLTNKLYHTSPTSTGGNPVYKVDYRGDKYAQETSNILVKTNENVKVSLTSANTFSRGESYYIPSHIYHEAVIPDQVCTATLIRMHRNSPMPSRVIGISGYPEIISFKRQACLSMDVVKTIPF